MFEDFKKKVKTYNDKPNRKLKSTKIAQEEVAVLKQNGLDPDNDTLEQLFPECLDSEGVDLSLVSGAEWDILFLYSRTRKFLLESYPQTKEAACRLGEVWDEADDAPVQINVALAKRDPKGKLFFELLCKAKTIFDKVMVLQDQASEYEKICLRFYRHLTHNRYDRLSCEYFGVDLLDGDVFETVEAYFKICRKYKVPILEEPYYFLNNQRCCEVKLSGDMLRRTTGYNDFEIRISILEELL